HDDSEQRAKRRFRCTRVKEPVGADSSTLLVPTTSTRTPYACKIPENYLCAVLSQAVVWNPLSLKIYALFFHHLDPNHDLIPSRTQSSNPPTTVTPLPQRTSFHAPYDTRFPTKARTELAFTDHLLPLCYRAAMPIEKYTIIVNEERFVFTRDQLESDPGNYFAQYFLLGFKEVPKGTREMEIEKEPLFFKLIQAHLRGYDIFPLPDPWIPSYMTKESALNNLFKEAQFYGLWNLQNKILEFQATEKANKERTKSVHRVSKKRYKLAVSILILP
ncbi:725_t:CDS:2, partial [Acaulospora colombiana]